MILQLGVQPSWFNTSITTIKKRPHSIPEDSSSSGDLRAYMIDSPSLGDNAVTEMLLKILEPYRKEGHIFLFMYFHLEGSYNWQFIYLMLSISSRLHT